jgi:hypothetical protein
MEIWIVSAEDLIISKLYWAKDSLSEIQLRDIKNLLSSIPDLDSPYILEWIRRISSQIFFCDAVAVLTMVSLS